MVGQKYKNQKTIRTRRSKEGSAAAFPLNVEHLRVVATIGDYQGSFDDDTASTMTDQMYEAILSQAFFEHTFEQIISELCDAMGSRILRAVEGIQKDSGARDCREYVFPFPQILWVWFGLSRVSESGDGVRTDCRYGNYAASGQLRLYQRSED